MQWTHCEKPTVDPTAVNVLLNYHSFIFVHTFSIFLLSTVVRRKCQAVIRWDIDPYAPMSFNTYVMLEVA